MPKTIRKTLLAKLQSSQMLSELKSDLHAMTGVQLRLVGPYGETAEKVALCSSSSFCKKVQSNPQGSAHCWRCAERLIDCAKSEEPFVSVCDAGLTSLCVPLRLGNEILGYLVAGGYRIEKVDLISRNRLRHLLERMNISEEIPALEALEQATVAISEARHSAIQRWLQLAAVNLIRNLESRKDIAERPLPAFVIKICSVIQRRYTNPPSLCEAADICGLNKSYFCRAFHEFTGLRFVEYIQAVRIEQVCKQLADRGRSITDIAFSVGFQSISQFNRVFRKFKGTAPRQWRSEQFSKRMIKQEETYA